MFLFICLSLFSLSPLSLFNDFSFPKLVIYSLHFKFRKSLDNHQIEKKFVYSQSSLLTESYQCFPSFKNFTSKLNSIHCVQFNSCSETIKTIHLFRDGQLHPPTLILHLHDLIQFDSLEKKIIIDTLLIDTLLLLIQNKIIDSDNLDPLFKLHCIESIYLSLRCLISHVHSEEQFLFYRFYINLSTLIEPFLIQLSQSHNILFFDKNFIEFLSLLHPPPIYYLNSELLSSNLEQYFLSKINIHRIGISKDHKGKILYLYTYCGEIPSIDELIENKKKFPIFRTSRIILIPQCLMDKMPEFFYQSLPFLISQYTYTTYEFPENKALDKVYIFKMDQPNILLQKKLFDSNIDDLKIDDNLSPLKLYVSSDDIIPETSRLERRWNQVICNRFKPLPPVIVRLFKKEDSAFSLIKNVTIQSLEGVHMIDLNEYMPEFDKLFYFVPPVWRKLIVEENLCFQIFTSQDDFESFFCQTNKFHENEIQSKVAITFLSFLAYQFVENKHFPLPLIPEDLLSNPSYRSLLSSKKLSPYQPSKLDMSLIKKLLNQLLICKISTKVKLFSIVPFIINGKKTNLYEIRQLFKNDCVPFIFSEVSRVKMKSSTLPQRPSPPETESQDNKEVHERLNFFKYIFDLSFPLEPVSFKIIDPKDHSSHSLAFFATEDFSINFRYSLIQKGFLRSFWVVWSVFCHEGTHFLEKKISLLIREKQIDTLTYQHLSHHYSKYFTHQKYGGFGYLYKIIYLHFLKNLKESASLPQFFNGQLLQILPTYQKHLPPPSPLFPAFQNQFKLQLSV